MRRIFFIIPVFLLFALSCNEKKEKITANPTASESIKTEVLKDTIKTYPLPKNYELVGTMKTNIVTYKGFQMGDLAHWEFYDEKGESIDINEITDKNNDYKFVVDAQPGEESEGGYIVNPYLVNKKFYIVWRTLHLKHEPKDEIEMYYQDYNQIVEIKQLD